MTTSGLYSIFTAFCPWRRQSTIDCLPNVDYFSGVDHFALLLYFVAPHSELSNLLGLWLKPFYNLGAQIFLLANNGLGAFLGPNWKVFHHGTFRNYFQGVCRAFWSWPAGENEVYHGQKMTNLFVATVYDWYLLHICIGYQIDEHKNPVYVPNNPPSEVLQVDFIKAKCANFWLEVSCVWRPVSFFLKELWFASQRNPAGI